MKKYTEPLLMHEFKPVAVFSIHANDNEFPRVVAKGCVTEEEALAYECGLMESQNCVSNVQVFRIESEDIANKLAELLTHCDVMDIVTMSELNKAQGELF